MAEKGNMITGARARFSIGGVKVGYARSVNVSEAINYEGAKVLDNIQVEEYVPLGYEVTFTASKFRIIGVTVKSRGWFPSLGANTEEHLRNVLTSGALVATVEDTGSEPAKTFITLEQVKVASQNYTIDAVGIVGEEITFNAIRCKDESEV